jgi:TonB family protein
MNDKNIKSSVHFTPSGCLTADALMLFVSGKLKGAELADTQQHISECPLCADAADGLRMWLNENSSLEIAYQNQDDIKPSLFHNRIGLLNERIDKRLDARKFRESEETKLLAYKPFLWLAAAASIILFVGVGYLFWLQNQQNESLLAQKQLKDREAALIAQIPENLAYPPSNSNVILNINYNSEKGSHIPPVVTIVNDDVTLASNMVRASKNSAAKTDDEAEYTETREGVESDVFREEAGIYKGQNAKRGLALRNSGGAMKKAETDEETNSVFISVQQMPSFPGGDAARKKYLSRTIRYPTQAVDDGIQGTIYVSFIVKTDGKITKVKLLRGIGGGCDEEALRVVSKMPQWIPGSQNGKKVDVLYNMPVSFTIKQ